MLTREEMVDLMLEAEANDDIETAEYWQGLLDEMDGLNG